MPRVLAAMAMMVAFEGSAWAETSWSTDQFTVSTDNLTPVTLAGGSVQVSWLPEAISNPASNTSWPPTKVDLTFAPQPGYVLTGELVSFTVDMDVAVYAPTDLTLSAVGSFAVDIDDEYTQVGTDSGGKTHRSGSYLLGDAKLTSVLDETATEGIACPLRHDANECNFGLDWVFLQAEVDFTSFIVTPLLSPVPEPGLRVECIVGLGMMGIAVVARRRNPAQLPAAKR